MRRPGYRERCCTRREATGSNVGHICEGELQLCHRHKNRHGRQETEEDAHPDKSLRDAIGPPSNGLGGLELLR